MSHLHPGDHIDRATRAKRFGGGKQGRIEPSARTPNIFIYSDPTRDKRYGYSFDGWSPDGGVFYYTGEGAKGDQRWSTGNLALLNHQHDDRAIRLFVADSFVSGRIKNHLYVGEFILDNPPYSVVDAPDEFDEQRSVFVFRLKPAGDCVHRKTDSSPAAERSSVKSGLVDLEQDNSYEREVSASEASTAIKREAQLVVRYRDYLEQQGHKLRRWRLNPTGGLHAMLTDIYDVTENELYEAKGSSSRMHVRLAIGQILDYRRFISPRPRRITLLLPGEPADDLLDLLTSLGIGCVWEDPIGGWNRVPSGLTETGPIMRQ